MTSQERFWQARLLSKESEHRGELSAIRQQLEALKATTEDAKADLAPSMKATDALPKQPVFEYSLEILSFLVCLFVSRVGFCHCLINVSIFAVFPIAVSLVNSRA